MLHFLICSLSCYLLSFIDIFAQNQQLTFRPSLSVCMSVSRCRRGDDVTTLCVCLSVCVCVPARSLRMSRCVSMCMSVTRCWRGDDARPRALHCDRARHCVSVRQEPAPARLRVDPHCTPGPPRGARTSRLRQPQSHALTLTHRPRWTDYSVPCARSSIRCVQWLLIIDWLQHVWLSAEDQLSTARLTRGRPTRPWPRASLFQGPHATSRV